MAEKWLQKANDSMERRGTKGKFGKATKRKISRAIAHGDKEKKRAIFARTMKRLAAKRKRRHASRSSARS